MLASFALCKSKCSLSLRASLFDFLKNKKGPRPGERLCDIAGAKLHIGIWEEYLLGLLSGFTRPG